MGPPDPARVGLDYRGWRDGVCYRAAAAGDVPERQVRTCSGLERVRPSNSGKWSSLVELAHGGRLPPAALPHERGGRLSPAQSQRGSHQLNAGTVSVGCGLSGCRVAIFRYAYNDVPTFVVQSMVDTAGSDCDSVSP